MKDAFFAMVDQLPSAGEAQRRGIEESIWQRFGVERAVLALDMSHFSLTVRRSGILSYLGLIRRMQGLTAPIIEQCGGTVVEFHADNVMAVFADAGGAADAAIRINRALAAHPGADGAPLIAVGIGIDYGRFLFVNGSHCYGDPVNVAFKLGEDLARPGEILLTDAARKHLGAVFPHAVTEQPASVSGLEFMTYRVNYQEPT